MTCTYKTKDGRCKKENINFCIGEACPFKQKRRFDMNIIIAFFLGAFFSIAFLALCMGGRE